MLTANLVRARIHKGELILRGLDGPTRERALEVAEAYVAALAEGIGAPRAEIDAALDEVPVAARDSKLALGLRKLLMDRCTFETPAGIDPPALRADLFTRAAAHRQALAADAQFDRAPLVAAVAAAHGLTAEALDEALYADLEDAQRLVSFDALSATALIDGLDAEQAKAALLYATRVEVTARFHDANAAREFFRKLKFRRLLFRITQQDEAWRIEIDGPFSLFQSTVRYGLDLALMLPTLAECAAYTLTAEVLWGKARRPVRLLLTGGGGDAAAEPTRLPDDVERLIERFIALDNGWQVARAEAVLNLPGVGLCVPDLVFTHTETGFKVLLEVLGYWSRKAVWRRVELAEAGLDVPILFAVTQRLRVSEQALPDDCSASLYVYKGAMSARIVTERLEDKRQRFTRS
ncbi:MAG: DUF790 family protein [Myxococcales bacterium]|nr:DUF790 family protein [Myxococcales bacterium]